MVHAAPFKHGKLISGEMMFVDYGTDAPCRHYGVVGADGQPRHHVPITLPGPRLPHDMAITRSLDNFDARDPSRSPVAQVAQVAVPRHIPTGFHGCWIAASRIAQWRKA